MNMKYPVRVNQCHNPIIGKNIKRLREKKHLRNIDVVTQVQLAGYDITASTLSKIERGASNPTADQLRILTKVLDCDYNAFFEEI